MSHVRKKTIEGLNKGDSFSISRTFTEKDVAQFADLTRDYNPVHFDERFAGAKKFKGKICHGLLVGSMLSEIGGQIGWLATEMNFQFKQPVYPGETIRCEFTITDIDPRGWATARIEYHNQHGELVLEALLRGILPGPQERRVMEAMVAEGDPTKKIR
jgi:acyl dehydratase